MENCDPCRTLSVKPKQKFQNKDVSLNQLMLWTVAMLEAVWKEEDNALAGSFCNFKKDETQVKNPLIELSSFRSWIW